MSKEMINQLQRQINNDFIEAFWNENGGPSEQQREFFLLAGATQPEPSFSMRDDGVSASINIRGEQFHISKIRTFERQRGEGRASKLLDRICQCADEAGVILTLRVEPERESGLGEQQLIDWYRRRGFTGDADEMTRTPRTID